MKKRHRKKKEKKQKRIDPLPRFKVRRDRGKSCRLNQADGDVHPTMRVS